MSQENQKVIKKEEISSARYWMDVHIDEFSKESDRAAVILTGSLIDNATETLLRTHLIPVPGNHDELFHGPNAPLSTSEAKINLCHRLGLISTRFSRDLHLIRKIRNGFAHNIHGCNFQSADVKSRVQELVKSFDVANSDPTIRKSSAFPEGVRGDFLMASSWLLYALNQKIDKIETINECGLEWGYIKKA